MEDEAASNRARARHRLWALGVLAICAVGAVLWQLWPRDSSEPEPIGSDEYAYATRGWEEVDALGGSRHEYPPRTGIRVEERPGEGCRELVWRPLRDRFTGWEVCGTELVAIRELHTFFGNRDLRTYRCEPGSSLRGGWSCSYGETIDTASGRIVARERIGGALVEHVVLERRIEGGVEGSGRREFWLRRDPGWPGGFPVRLAASTSDVSPSPIGDVRYRERYELELEADPDG